MPKNHRSRSHLRTILAITLSVAMMPAFTSTAAAAPAPPRQTSHGSLTTVKESVNRGIVLGFFEALNRGNFDYLDKTVRPDLVQHYPEVADGRAAFRKYHMDLRKQNPASRFSVKRTMAQNDLVVVHSHFVPKAGDLGVAKINLFRLDRGKIAEHWEVNEAVRPQGIGNDMFSTLSSPRISWPLPLSTDAASERVGRAAFAEIINQPNDEIRLGALERYIGDNTYFQHFPDVPNGSAGLQQFVHDAFVAQPEYLANVKTVVADGDLVAVVVHLEKLFNIENSVSIDLFRVRNGKLLEHWASAQPIPATSANPHTMY
jgi:predicted SnoaL-like aldol condensation-catalyzing enzyme